MNLVTSNRTSVELKRIGVGSDPRFLTASNRTSVELKPLRVEREVTGFGTSNRTSVELKRVTFTVTQKGDSAF